MRKTGFMLMAFAAALPFAASSALAQAERPGAGGAAAARPAAAAPAPAAAPAAGGGMRGAAEGGGRIGGGRIGGGVAIAPQGGGSWVGRPGWNGNPGWHGHRHHRQVFGPSIYFGNTYAGYPYPYGYYDDYAYDDYPSVTVGPGMPDEVAYCRQRYRSYDINTGTFLGNDGRRHPCP